MKKIVPFILGVAMGLSALGGCGDNSIDVYLIGGQSNAVGNAYMEDLSADDLNKNYENTLYYAEGTVSEAAYGTLTYVTTETDKGQGWTPAHFGVEVGMAKKFQKESKDKRALIKCAFNGSSINKNNTSMGSWWTEATEIPNVSIKCYDRFIQAVLSGMQALRDEGYNPKIKAMVWLQGESNAGNSSYLQDLRTLRDKIRALFSVPDMYFVAGEISNAKYGVDCAVNVAVHEFASDDNCDYVACGELPLDTRTNNIYHWTGAYMLQIGEMFADKLLENV